MSKIRTKVEIIVISAILLFTSIFSITAEPFDFVTQDIPIANTPNPPDGSEDVYFPITNFSIYAYDNDSVYDTFGNDSGIITKDGLLEDFQEGTRVKVLNGSGYINSITGYFKYNGYNGNMSCALYEYVDNTSDYAGDRLAVTEEKWIIEAGSGYRYITFNFTTHPLVTNNTDYYACAWAEESIIGGGWIYITGDAGNGSGFYVWDSYDNSWPDPFLFETKTNYTYNFDINYSRTDELDVSFWTNESGSWQLAQTNASVINTTCYLTNTSWVDEYNTTYYWSTNITDLSGGWHNTTYSFTTVNLTDIFNSNPSPANGSTGVSLPPENFSVYVDDPGKIYINSTCHFGNMIEDTRKVGNLEDFQGGAKITATNGSGYADSMTWYIRTNAYAGNVSGALYEYVDNTSNYAGDKIAETEEIHVIRTGAPAYEWFTLNFTTEPYIDNNTDYYACIWGEEGWYNPAGWIQIAGDPGNGSSWYIYNVYDGDWDDPITGETGFDRNYDVYIDYAVNKSNENINVSFWTNESGAWLLAQENNSVETGFYYLYNKSWVDAYEKTYYWSANTTDNKGNWDNDTYSFTTTADSVPEQSGESPVNGSTVGPIPWLYTLVLDEDGNDLDIIWRSNSSGSWEIFESIENVQNNTNISVFNINFSTEGETYYWSVNVTDGDNWINETYHFTLQTGYGLLKWRNSGILTGGLNYSPAGEPIAVDINGDGIYEIFHAGTDDPNFDNATIFCLNGSTGEIIWQKYMSASYLVDWHIPLACDDLDNDGDYELVHAAGYRTVARNAEDGSVFWDVAQDSGWGAVAIADTDDNGYPYVYVSSNTAFEGNAATRKLNGTTGALVNSSTDTSYTCYGGVSIADLDRDGEFEIVMSDSGDSICYDEDLESLWTTAGFTSESHCAMLINLTGDEDLEVIIARQDMSAPYDAGFYSFYSNGTQIAGKCDSTLGMAFHCQPACYDFDEDGHVEIADGYAGQSGIVWDWDDWSSDGTLEHMSEPPDFVNVGNDSSLEILSGAVWDDGSYDIYNESCDNIGEISGYGIYFIVQDVDNDGYNEICSFGPGVGNFSCYDTFAVAASPSVRTDTSYYSERRLATGVYVPKIGGKCLLEGVTPANGSTDVPTSTSRLNVTVSEPDGDEITWWIRSSLGCEDSSGDSNGSKNCTISGLENDTTYTWWINATDGVNWIREMYTFTTAEGDNPPSQANENPANNSNSVPLTPLLNVTVNDTDGGFLNATWLSNSEGSWEIFASNNSIDVSSGSVNIMQTNSNFSTYDEFYYWSVNLSDGNNWTNRTYRFRTIEEIVFDFYVNGTSGSDDNNGTFGHPWATITHAMDNITAGQTVHIMEGEYQEYVSAWGVTANSGNETDWITYRNYENDTVIIDGSLDNDECDGLIWFINESYIRITGLIFRNSSCDGVRFDGSGGYDTHNITVDNCTFYNCSDSAVYVYAGNPAYGFIEDVIIENNTMYDCQNGWNHEPYAPNEVITISNTTRFHVRYNYMFNNHKVNIDCKNQATEGYVYGNRINTTPTPPYGLGNGGIYVDAYDDDASNISIFNNIVWGNTTGYTLGTEIGGTLHNISVYNNVYNGTGHAFQINNHTDQDGSHLKTDIKYINNVIYNASVGFFFTDLNSSLINMTIRNNIIDNSSASGIYIPIKPNMLLLEYHNVDHNLYNVSFSTSWGDNAVNGTPKFVDPNNGNFNLTSLSPAIEAGSNIDAPLTDYWGQSRVGTTDIGIFEYQGNIAPHFVGETPGNQSSSVSVFTGNINVTIYDANGDTFDWTIEVNNSDSSSGNAASNGSKSCSLTTPLAYSCTYTWWVNSTDGENENNATYNFTTSDFISFNLTDEYPENESVGQSRPPINLSARVNGSNVDIYIYYLNMTPTTDIVELLGVWTEQESGYYNISSLINESFTTQFIWGNTEYVWYMNITNGSTWLNETFYYTTEGSRYDIDASGDVVATDASVTWSSRAGEKQYDGIYDVDDGSDITATDASLVWSNRT